MRTLVIHQPPVHALRRLTRSPRADIVCDSRALSPQSSSASMNDAAQDHPIYSCLMADGPAYAQQTLTFVWTLLDLAHVPADRIVVHALDDADDTVLRHVETIGVRTRRCAAFDAAHPHCNKLRQLDDPALLAAPVIVLCDTDLAFVRPFDVAVPRGARAKIVDLPNPPIDVWRAVFAAADLPFPSRLVRTSFGDHVTPPMSCNGGLYVLSSSAAVALRDAWPRWATWLIERADLLPGPMRVHIDQIAFGLAAAELALDLDPLPLEDNCPTHLPGDLVADVAPRVLHYHGRVDASGFLLPTSAAGVDQAIATVNDVIRRRRRAAFDNRTFWDFRYRHAPDLGSGIGSRGAALDAKREILARVIAADASVLDVGCGDLEASRTLRVARYTGVDVSEEALALARTKRPDWTFRRGQLRDLDVDAHDVAVCLDVLIHQRTYAAYRSLVATLLRAAGRVLIVSGYNQPPWHQSEMTFFHEPLTASLRRLVDATRIEILAGVRDVTVVRVDLSGDVARDSTLDRLRRLRRHDTPLGRFVAVDGDLISTQFDAFGGHTRGDLAMLLSLLDPGDVVVDAGAHIGSFAIPLARRVGPAGRVVAIEPAPITVELLYQNLDLNDVAGMVDVVERVVSEDAAGHRLVTHETNTGAWHFVADATSRDARAATLDEIVAEALADRRVRLIKIDVEGMELSALRSADATIASHRPILYCEISTEQLARHGTSVSDVDRFFADRRYALFRNVGARLAASDDFTIAPMTTLSEGGAFFDCLAVPIEHVAGLQAAGRLPA
jgi:FkbM family methyltransferase